MKTMGRRIRNKREDMGLTQEELGKMLGVSRQTICKWESGDVKHFDREFISKMADIFKCEPAWLMNMEDSKVTLTYEAPEREPVKVTVSAAPVLGETGKRAKLYAVAAKVAPENLDIAIDVLVSLAPEKEAESNVKPLQVLKHVCS